MSKAGKSKLNKKDVMMFGLIMEADLSEDGFGTTYEDYQIYRKAFLEAYGITDDSPVEKVIEAESNQKKDVIELVSTLRSKLKLR